MIDARDARAWLDSHVNLETGVGVPARGGVGRRLLAVERERPLLELLGSPQTEYPAVHVTGTNGKTSVARILTALLSATGLSVGSYTSPHLHRVNERMARDGVPIDDATLDELLAAVSRVEPLLPDPPSYFEILTAAALRWFGDEAVDVAVVEVGLGGTGDATNAVDGRVAVVTNVSLDHVEYIGPTVADVAREKAGIVKPGCTLVLGETDDALAAPFLERGAARVVRRGRDFRVAGNRLAHGGRLLDLVTPEARYEEVFLALHGAHQADNASIALVAAESFLGTALAPDLVADAFRRVRVPGRLEVVGHQPLVLLDGVKNVAGAHALRDALAEEFGVSPRTYVVGLMREKEPLEMLDALGVAGAERLVCCRPNSPRGRDPKEVARAAIELGSDPARVDVVDDVARAVDDAIASAGPAGQVVVAGSLYVVAPAREHLVRHGSSARDALGGG